jgi:uncharacterized protein
MLFGHDHRFEAYVPAAKRVLGYFALPVTVGDEVVAALDLKADRKESKLLIQKWTWLNGGEQIGHKALIEAELERFERFQLAAVATSDESGEQNRPTAAMPGAHPDTKLSAASP